MRATASIQKRAAANRFPRTRYQGSKRKLADAIVQQVDHLDFSTVLDAFGGTGAVAYAFKRAGKRVTYNDLLTFNHQIGLALIENDSVRLSEEEVESIGGRTGGVAYDDFIERTFEGIYFTQEENRWLDRAVVNIGSLRCSHKRAIAWFALSQAAMAKRPYNLFHRANLYMRTADVQRSFGNKASWDRSFEDHFRKYALEANAAVLDTRLSCRALRGDALTLEGRYDLVYIDTPYINRSGVGVDYRDFYHFLEGLLDYENWPQRIDRKSKHLRLERTPDPWSDRTRCHEMFRRLFARFRESILVVSYRSDGIPSVAELTSMLREVKRSVSVIEGARYQYVLSTKRETREVLLIGCDQERV